MKKNFLALSIASALLVASTVASAAVSDSFTLGVRGGFANADMNISNPDLFEDSNSGFNYGVYGGYHFNDYFGLEIGYNVFDGFSVKDRLGNTGDFKIHGPEIAARLAYPLSSTGSDLFFRAGGMYAFSDSDFSSGHDTFAPLIGLGVQFMATENVGFRLGYDRYFDVYDAGSNDADQGLDVDLDNVYLAFQYVFTPKKAPEPVKTVTQTVTTSYNLDANTTFGFDSNVLSEQGKASVNQVVVDVKNSNLQFAKYHVTGYSDRVGNPDYNLKLSEKRANAVTEELINLGVDASSIVTVGAGSVKSVTGTDCDGLSGKKLIQCLSPDRRVEVNVTGTVTKTQDVPVK